MPSDDGLQKVPPPECRVSGGSGAPLRGATIHKGLSSRRPSPTLAKYTWSSCRVLNLTDRPAELKEEIFRLLFKSAEIATFTPQERVKYQNDMTTQRDIQNQIAYAERKGEAKGMAEGLAKGLAEGKAEGVAEGRVEGKAEGKTETARNLKRLGVPVATIAEATGLTVEEVEAL